ncbi:ATP-binding protein [Alteromonas ponticola]|uniref:histidine kinase n=1 Tax=Alteromonas aquimaris TaxID=2998417 RepID=A0ABT3P3F5_9ALTE|nr:ATP-binding protein [Alteromonas aquimaris]MCW8107307.1 ATP-binding protein [Alteromonas aquimaris]
MRQFTTLILIAITLTYLPCGVKGEEHDQYNLILVNSFNESDFEARLMYRFMHELSDDENVLILTVPPFYADAVSRVSAQEKKTIVDSFKFQLTNVFPEQNISIGRIIALGRHASMFLETNPELLPGAKRFFLHIDWQPESGVLIPSDYDPEVSVRQIIDVFPQSKAIALVYGSKEEKLDEKVVNGFVEAVPADVDLIVLNPRRRERESLERLQSLPPGSPIIYINYKYFERNWEQAHRWITTQTDYPVFTIFAHNVERYLGGAVVVPEKLADAAVRLARGELLPRSANPVLSMQFNAQQLSRWNLSENDLPPQSEVVNRTDSVISLQTVLVIGSVFSAIIIMMIATMLYKSKIHSRNLKLVADKADAANKAKSEFLSNMSHEIRTPMNGILGVLQLMERKELAPASKDLVKKATYSAKSLLTIINDILDYSKIEANKLDLEQAPFAMMDVLESVVSDMSIEAHEKGIRLQSLVNANFDDGWIGDVVRVRQILLNLVSNAVKFTQHGKVIIELKHINESSNEGICFNVIDSGIGMSVEAQNRIFERFAQADTSTTRKFGGTGLGMSISISLIQLMHGNIALESIEGKGTTVSVTLPLNKAVVNRETKNDSLPEAPRMDNFRILVAEDNEINKTIIETMLQPTQAQVELVSNGKLAVEAFEEKPFDIVLMDIQMPEMDGIQAFKLINNINSGVPVIALTANVMPDEISYYLGLGFHSHIGKPIDMAKLYDTLKQLKDNLK